MHRIRRIGMSDEKIDSPIRILWLIIRCNENSLSFIELNANLIVEMIINFLSVSTVYNCTHLIIKLITFRNFTISYRGEM